MVAMLCLVLAVATVLAVVRTVARLMVSAIWALGLLALLGWLAVSPDVRLFPAAWWALAAWVIVTSLRRLPRRCRGIVSDHRYSRMRAEATRAPSST